jgi:YidC/Oxa1 family membrane protein insertase
MSAIFGVPVDAAYRLVSALTNVLAPLPGGLAVVAGIVVFTVAVRLIVMPLSFRALRGQAAMARLAPQIQALRQRHARQPERLRRELEALYRKEGTRAFAGLVPLLAQWPVFSVLYLLFRSPDVAGGPNRLLSGELLGVPLGSHWLPGTTVLSARGAVFPGLLAILAVICWLSARAARGMTATAAPAGAGGAPGPLAKVLPYLTVVIAALAPLAAAVYLVVSAGWSAAERWLFVRTRGARQTGGVPPRGGHTLGKRADRP